MLQKELVRSRSAELHGRVPEPAPVHVDGTALAHRMVHLPSATGLWCLSNL